MPSEEGVSASRPHADAFVEAVLAVVASIPPGRVMAYGEVAAVLGSRAARTVGTIMARYGHGVPWWRVVRAGGLPAAGHEQRALAHYQAEGTPLLWVDSGSCRVDMRAARHRP